MKTLIRQGLRIKIENEVGTTRKGVDKDGKPWAITMSYDYGEILNSKGVDGDPVDVFLGPNKSAKFVYVVHQTTKDGNRFDEDKCFMGFDNAMDAKQAFYKNYDIPDFFFGDVQAIPIQEFKKLVFKNKGKLIRASRIIKCNGTKMDIAIALYAENITR